jgi:hypothetical protein
MALSLGPMPDSVRAVVQRLVAEAQLVMPQTDGRLGYVLTGGPSGASYIDAGGDVWNFFFDWNDSGDRIEPVPDGPMKVGLIAIAANRVPGLAEWLPVRPSGASDCPMCHQSGWLQPPHFPPESFQCPNCFGMGWLD